VTPPPTGPNANASDAELVGACLAGNRGAFAHIVTRYQALVASIAYSSTGSIAQSEDLAQEAFVTAWRHLGRLADPAKLRAWLCGITRRITANSARRGAREPAQFAETLDEAVAAQAPEPPPVEQAISREEEAILWRSLEQIPADYREALVLYYRQGHATGRVAAELGLTEAAVRQRLSRGRRLLEERVAAFVETTLRRSAPGASFTANVLAALPAPIGAAGLATAGASAAKAGAAKSAVMLAGLNAVISFLPGMVSLYHGYQTEMAGSPSVAARSLVRRFYTLAVGTVVVPVLLILLAVWLRAGAVTHPRPFSLLVLASGWMWLPAVAVLLALLRRKSALLAATPAGAADPPVFEYRSRAEFLGAPLVHARFGGAGAVRAVRAWIALGDVAVGRLFALGGVAVAPVCIGGFGAGLAVFGGFAVGPLVYAGYGLGFWALGGFVTGWLAAGACAIAGDAGLGGICLAGRHALGGIALAPHANDAVARAYLEGSMFFHYAYLLMTRWLWPTMIAATIPILALQLAFRRRRRQENPFSDS